MANLQKIDLAAARELGPHMFEADASALGLPPSTWPSRLACDNGNKLPLFLTEINRDGDGDIVSVRYLQDLGVISLRIWND